MNKANKKAEVSDFLDNVYDVAKNLCKDKWGMPQLAIALAIDTETKKVVGTLHQPGSSVEWVLGYEDIGAEDYEVQEIISQAEHDAWEEWNENFADRLYEAVESGLITEEECSTAVDAEYGTDGHGGILDPLQAADEAIKNALAYREEEAPEPVLDEYWMTVTDSKGVCKFHKCSWARGYISRTGSGHGGVLAYKGRYGEGYKVYTASWESTRYCHVRYYIREGEKAL
jgi:hypothetical protein